MKLDGAVRLGLINVLLVNDTSALEGPKTVSELSLRRGAEIEPWYALALPLDGEEVREAEAGEECSGAAEAAMASVREMWAALARPTATAFSGED